MRYRAYGEKGRETVLLLHGGGLSWWNYREEARLLQSDYRVILPVLDGHAGSGRPFVSIERSAADLIAFIEGELGGPAALIGGLSLGAQILLEMLSQRGDICRCALVESASVLPSGLTRALAAPAVALSYGWIRSRRFAALQFRALHMRPELFEDYYRDTCGIARGDLAAFLKANAAYALKPSLGDCTARVRVFAGEKEARRILRSAEAVRRAVPGCEARILPGLYHGGFSLGCPEAYAREVRAMLAER